MSMKSIDEMDERPQIDLTGPDGNAYVLMAKAKRWAEQLGKDGDKIIERMMASDYENLLKVLEEEFGDYVDFYR